MPMGPCSMFAIHRLLSSCRRIMSFNATVLLAALLLPLLPSAPLRAALAAFSCFYSFWLLCFGGAWPLARAALILAALACALGLGLGSGCVLWALGFEAGRSSSSSSTLYTRAAVLALLLGAAWAARVVCADEGECRR